MPVVVLEYHDIIEGADWRSSGFSGNSADSYKMSATRFDSQLAAVANVPNVICNDIRSIDSCDDADRVVLFTFDDGGRGALVAADLLERRGWRGHFLITTGRIGTTGFLSAANVLMLHRRGHVIGSHSETHPARMSLVPMANQIYEWTESRRKLENIIGAPVIVASVPGGYYDRRTALAASAAGILRLFTSEPVGQVELVDQCVVFGRYTLRRDSDAAIALALVGSNPVARRRQWFQWTAKKLAKRVAGNMYLRLRAMMYREAKL